MTNEDRREIERNTGIYVSFEASGGAIVFVCGGTSDFCNLTSAF